MGLIWRQVAGPRSAKVKHLKVKTSAAAVPLIPDAIPATLDAVSQPPPAADSILSARCVSHVKF